MQDVDTLLVLSPESVPDELRHVLNQLEQPTTLASLELLPDGRLAIQMLPEVDPRFVARIRRLLAQHADVLRRLT